MVPETHPPKVKYLIIVGVNAQYIFTIYINSDIRFQNINSAPIQGLQVPITPQDCGFLTHDSFADCSTLINRDKQEINAILQKEPGRREGVIPPNIMSIIIQILTAAKTISLAEKQHCGLL